jgi:hypothetical protein
MFVLGTPFDHIHQISSNVEIAGAANPESAKDSVRYRIITTSPSLITAPLPLIRAERD